MTQKVTENVNKKQQLKTKPLLAWNRIAGERMLAISCTSETKKSSVAPLNTIILQTASNTKEQS